MKTFSDRIERKLHRWEEKKKGPEFFYFLKSEPINTFEPYLLQRESIDWCVKKRKALCFRKSQAERVEDPFSESGAVSEVP